MNAKKIAIIFGGTGFIGIHFSRHLLDKAGFDHIVLADIKPPSDHVASRFIADDLRTGRIRYIESDVRRPIAIRDFQTDQVELIANFAAVHREPGHPSNEYFETNIPGARSVCEYSERINCRDIIFTSSISPYGPSEVPKDENFIPTPETAYGSSKLAAELIHTAWVEKDAANRKLLIVRPGVVFGPGEGGNVSRLIKMLTRGFFVYAGNKKTRKAGIYVKELCNAIWWMHELQKDRTNTAIRTVNLTMSPGPSMQEYVDAIQRVSDKKALVPSIPVWLLMGTARLIHTLTTIIGIQTSVNVVRVRKIIRSNNILPGVLVSEKYPYIYTLDTALSDWRKSLPEEWQR